MNYNIQSQMNVHRSKLRSDQFDSVVGLNFYFYFQFKK